MLGNGQTTEVSALWISVVQSGRGFEMDHLPVVLW
jgi:hypothetical protein